jgi:hypothetical protein
VAVKQDDGRTGSASAYQQLRRSHVDPLLDETFEHGANPARDFHVTDVRAGPGLGQTSAMPYLSPTDHVSSNAQVFLAYLDYFREQVSDKLAGLSEDDLRTSRVPSGWSPLELLKHLLAVERRWMVWGFEGEAVDDPWFDQRDDRWYVGLDETLADLLDSLHAGGRRTRAIVEGLTLDDVGMPGERWDGADPPRLERVLFHLLQEFARHVGHLDIVRELIDGKAGE